MSIQVSILGWWQVGLVIRHERAKGCIKSPTVSFIIFWDFSMFY